MTSRWTPKVHTNPNPQKQPNAVDENGGMNQDAEKALEEGQAMTNPSPGWAFFSSPQFSVIAATVVVLIAGATMYDRLDGKLDALRADSGSSLEKAVDKIDKNFDKIDSKIHDLSGKIDDGNREIRMLLQVKPATSALPQRPAE